MLSATIKGMLVHKLRLFLTVTSIALGVAFLSGTLMMNSSMQRAFDGLFQSINAGTDAVVRGAVEGEQPGPGEPRPAVPASVLEDVRGVEGVTAAEGMVEGYALLTDSDGQPIQPAGAPTLGMTLPTDPSLLGETELRAGGPPASADEVAVDASSFEKGNLALGDKITVMFQGPARTFTVVGAVGYGEADDLGGATAAYFDVDTAQRLLGNKGSFDSVVVKAANGTSDDDLTQRIQASLPAGLEAITGEEVADEQTEAVTGGLGFITMALTGFAGIALFVGSFIIWNTFSMQVAQRTRELALLRAIGATRRQVLRTIVVEAAVLGAGASAIGLLLGVGMSRGLTSLMGFFGLSMPSAPLEVEASTIAIGLAVGTLITVAAAVAPARRATKVLPVEALRDTPPAAERFSRIRLGIGALMVTVGVGILATALFGPADALMIPVGVVASILGLTTLAPLFMRGLAGVISWPLLRRGVPGELARQNAMRNPKRTASTAMALVIGLTMVATVSVFAASFKASFADALSSSTNADLYVLTPSSQSKGYSPEVVDMVRDVEGVETISPTSNGKAEFDVAEAAFTSIDPATAGDALNLGMVQGAVTDLTDDGVVVKEAVANSHGWELGDVIAGSFPGAEHARLEIQGTYEAKGMVNTDYVISGGAHTTYFPDRLEGTAMVLVADGQDIEVVEDRIADVIVDQPDATVMTQAEFEGEASAVIDQMLGLVTVLLLLAVVIALLGIVNTLALSVFERTRELGLLRAVGMTRGQVRAMVRWESVVISLIGALVGAGLGVGLGAALTRALADEGLEKIAIPLDQLGLYIAAAALAGVLAAIGPSRSASNVDVLRAVVTD